MLGELPADLRAASRTDRRTDGREFLAAWLPRADRPLRDSLPCTAASADGPHPLSPNGSHFYYSSGSLRSESIIWAVAERSRQRTANSDFLSPFLSPQIPPMRSAALTSTGMSRFLALLLRCPFAGSDVPVLGWGCWWRWWDAGQNPGRAPESAPWVPLPALPQACCAAWSWLPNLSEP